MQKTNTLTTLLRFFKKNFYLILNIYKKTFDYFWNFGSFFRADRIAFKLRSLPRLKGVGRLNLNPNRDWGFFVPKTLEEQSKMSKTIKLEGNEYFLRDGKVFKKHGDKDKEVSNPNRIAQVTDKLKKKANT